MAGYIIKWRNKVMLALYRLTYDRSIYVKRWENKNNGYINSPYTVSSMTK